MSMAKQDRLFWQNKMIAEAAQGKGTEPVPDDAMWTFSLKLDEVKPAVWSCCGIIASFTVQMEVMACPLPRDASVLTVLGQMWWGEQL